MQSFNWKCPYCNHAATITESNFISNKFFFNHDNKDGLLGINTRVIICPNSECKEYSVTSSLHKAQNTSCGPCLQGAPIFRWALRPQSQAKPFPSYIPQPILDDYKEACLIKDLSPKASATLSRRCLQGIIRDYWSISKNRLVDEINELKGKIDATTWDAIDAVRSIGNIGAHMEKDINLVIDVEPEEAELLIGLIEILLKDWYVARNARKQHLASIVSVAQAKKEAGVP
ncbi:MAG: DUF4145 domain-containing protein [Zoogloeaceae bacterium]|jgi:hypothetical protein|nr:DUF4145 domain-containing protein [Zoogloeaceae bacterium]